MEGCVEEKALDLSIGWFVRGYEWDDGEVWLREVMDWEVGFRMRVRWFESEKW